MSLIFFAQTFCIVFTLNYVSHNLGAVHKQCGPKRGRGRQFFLMYGITWFIVSCMSQGSKKPLAKSSEGPMIRRNLLEKVVSEISWRK